MSARRKQAKTPKGDRRHHPERSAREHTAERPLVVVVAKQTSYSRYVADGRDPRTRQLLSQRDRSVDSWRDAHREHQQTLRAVKQALARLDVRTSWVFDAHSAFETDGAALVIAVGGDGTLLAASHHVGSAPILGVNSAPGHSVGFFCGARRPGIEHSIEKALAGTLPRLGLTRMQVRLNGRLRERRVLNDALFAHRSPAATSRYLLEVGRIAEDQRSSGIWIGPAAGSTAAQRSAGGRVLPLGARRLQLVVREPYTPEGKPYRLAKCLIEPGQRVVVRSKMDDSMLWLDGPHKTLRVRLGDELEFSLSDEPLALLGIGERRSRA